MVIRAAGRSEDSGVDRRSLTGSHRNNNRGTTFVDVIRDPRVTVLTSTTPPRPRSSRSIVRRSDCPSGASSAERLSGGAIISSIIRRSDCPAERLSISSS